MFVLQQRYPLLFPLLGLVTGIYAASRFEVLTRFPWLLLIFVGLLALFLYFYWKNPVIRIVLIISLFFFLGAFNLGRHFFKLPPPQIREWVQAKSRVEVQFKVVDYCRVKNGNAQAKADLQGWLDSELHPLSLPVMVKFKSEDCSWKPGDIYQARVRWSFPRRFQNSFSFDYPHYLRAQGLFAIAWISEPEQARFKSSEANIFQNFLAERRAQILRIIEAEISDPKISGLIEALILGEEKRLGSDLEEAFRQSGLTHLLVVSGLHLTLIFLCFYFPIYFLFFLHPRWSERGLAKKLALCAALFPTLAYAAMVGMLPSVLRALCLVALGVLAVIKDWRKDFGALLLMTVFILLGLQPLLLWSLSFQFSLISVATIYFYGKSFQAWMKLHFEGRAWFKFKLLRAIPLAFFTSFMVNLALYPILANSFHEVSWIAPLANLFLVPIFSFLLQPGTLIALLLSCLTPNLGHLLFSALVYVVGLAIRLVEFFAHLPSASTLVSPLHACEFLAFFFLLAAFLNLRRSRYFTFLLCCALNLWGGQRCYDFLKSLKPELKITMMDVGQGDSMLLELPEGRALLIDGGGIPYSHFDMGKNVLMPELLGRKQPPLAALVMTHADADHIKGFEYLVERMKPEEFWLSPMALEMKGFSQLREKLAKKNISLRLLKSGDAVQLSSVSFRVFWPLTQAAQLSENNQSLVLQICYEKLCLLSTGDIEQEAEDALLASGLSLSSAILKVAHHGSNTSSSTAFLKAVHPRLALISAGRDNQFGFPRSQVLERLKLEGISILRTDSDGQIRITTDGERISYETDSGLTGEIDDLP